MLTNGSCTCWWSSTSCPWPSWYRVQNYWDKNLSCWVSSLSVSGQHPHLCPPPFPWTTLGAGRALYCLLQLSVAVSTSPFHKPNQKVWARVDFVRKNLEFVWDELFQKSWRLGTKGSRRITCYCCSRSWWSLRTVSRSGKLQYIRCDWEDIWVD